MPVRSNITVVNQPYNISGNGGRKSVKLKNDWLIACAIKGIGTSSSSLELYKSIDNGASFPFLSSIPISNVSNSMANSFSLTTDGEYVYLIYNKYITSFFVTFAKIECVTGNVLMTTDLTTYSSFAHVGANTIAYDSEDNSLHVAISDKTPTYLNSFNIRYFKGTINTNGSVMWGAVEQVTSTNSGDAYNMRNPSIQVINSVPSITYEGQNQLLLGAGLTMGNQGIQMVKRDSSLPLLGSTNGSLHDAWSLSTIHQTTTAYTQQSPSALFVPQSINDLPNGRVWVAWHGKESNSAHNGLRVRYSDDEGITWVDSLFRTATSSFNAINPPSITVGKGNKVMVVYAIGTGALMYDEYLTNGTWYQRTYTDSIPITGHVSALLDSSVEFSRPLMIYSSADKVGFYGSWVITNSSVPEGSIGAKDNPNNLLSYSITRDGTMSEIVEKVNGVEVGRKTATSGQQLAVNLTQEQWDEVAFGKYASSDANLNTLSIEMGNNKWFYTFDKRLAEDSDIISIAKATKDTSDVFLPVVKSKLVDKVGGSPTDTFEKIIDGIELGVKKASGTVLSSTATKTFQNLGNTSNTSMYYVTVTGLPFTPKRISLFLHMAGQNYIVEYRVNDTYAHKSTIKVAYTTGQYSTSSATWSFKGDTDFVEVGNGFFTLPVGYQNILWNWEAYSE